MITTRPDPAAVLAEVTDPELPMLTLVDLGVLRNVVVDGEDVIVEITPTYSGCPAMTEMRAGVARRLTEAGYRPEVRTVLDPPWSTDDITAHGRAVLRAHGIAPPGTAPRRTPGAPTPVQIGRRPPEVVCPRCGASATERVAEFGATACKALYRCRSCHEPFEYIKAI